MAPVPHHHVPSRKSIVQASSAPKKIARIQFGTMSTEEIQRVAQLQVSSRVLFQMPDRRAAAHGCMDPRLGISDKMSHCKTCHKKLTDCAGHFGYIQLELPVFHAGYFKHTLTLLQCICKKCSRVLVSPQLRQQLLKRIATGNVDALARAALFKKVRARAASAHTHSVPPTSPLPPRAAQVIEQCKRSPICPYCNYSNGVVKKVAGGFLKIVHEKFRAKSTTEQVGTHDKQVWPCDLCC